MARRRDAAVIPARDPIAQAPDIKKDRESAASACDAEPLSVGDIVAALGWICQENREICAQF